MTRWVEIRKNVRRSREAPLLVPLGKEADYTGFRSVYAYDDATAERIEQSRSSAGLSGCNLYSDSLLLDCDDYDVSFFVRCWLTTSGIGFDEYETGNRGAHYHIPIAPMEGASVPYSQKQWVSGNLIGVDTSMYHSAGQFRLPRTLHEKTERPKVLVSSEGGSTLTIPMLEPRAFVPMSERPTRLIRDLLLRELFKPASPGGREPHIFILCCCCRDLGYSVDQAIDLCLFWNKNYATPPHEVEYVRRTVQAKYYVFGRSRN